MPRKPLAGWALLLLSAIALPVRADVKITITGVDGEERKNVETRLSVSRYRENKDLDDDTMRRLTLRIDAEVRSGLRPFGYYEPTVKYDYRAAGKDWQVTINIERGEPVRVRDLDIQVKGPGNTDPAFQSVLEDSRTLLRTRMVLRHDVYEKVKDLLSLTAQNNGYREANFTKSVMEVDEKAHAASISLVLDTGPRYSFGSIDIQQTVIRQRLMDGFVRFKEGDPYNGTEVLRTQYALDDSQYFSEVNVDVGDPDRNSLTVPVTISATKSRPTFSLGAGYGTDTGVRGTIAWTDARVNDRGHRFRAEIKASTRTRQVDARYDIPIGDPALERMSLEGQNSYDESADIKTNTLSLTPSITRVHGLWQVVTSVAATRTSTDKGLAKTTNSLLVPGIAIASVPKNFLGEAQFSRALYAEVIGSHSALGSDSNFLRLLVQSEHGFDLNLKWHLLLRGEVGASLVSNFADLPGIYRFFAGGDRSVRGFAYQSLSPEEEVPADGGGTELKKTGGRYLVVGSTELVRDLPWNLAVATFFDFGNAFNDLHTPLEYAVGVGVRYRLPGVSIGIDVAKPLSVPNGKLRLHLNITPKL